MKWSLSEIKKHAKTVLEIAGAKGTSNEVLFALKDAVCATHCIGKCREGTCSKLQNLWVPLELLTNQETELKEEIQRLKDEARQVEGLVRTCLFSCAHKLEEIVGEVKP